jgi:hypothetical protein
MKNLLATAGSLLLMVVVVWGLLTLWVEAEGPAKSQTMGNPASDTKALIVYDPDPLYNLDEKVCKTFGKTLAAQGLRVKIATIAAFSGMSPNAPALGHYDLYVFCANTYNWRPDWAVSDFIQSAPIAQKPVVAITLGSGSTAAAQRTLEKIISDKEGQLISSRSFWLVRPNDETRLEGSNVAVCLEQVTHWASTLGDSLPRP